ncbi:MAG: oligopeptide/dipeptide ABC transporter ATP-binding protein [Pseudomonadota bacterium]
MNGPLLEARGVRKTFTSRAAVVHAVDDVDLTIARGQTLALVGESGSGKSTLGRILARLIDADAGSLRFDGVDIGALRGRELRALRRRIQMVFQDPFASLNPRLSIFRAISQPMALHDRLGGQDRRAAVAAELARVGLPESALARYPHEFSGGQRQRIGIARAVALRPELLICDEPVSALDVSVQAQVLNLLKALQGEFGVSMLFIAHDLAVVANIAGQVAVMFRGRIVEEGPTATVLRTPRHPYTQALVASVPRLDGARVEKPDAVAGEPITLREACLYAAQCTFATAQCRSERPRLKPLEGGASVACHNALTVPPLAAGPPAGDASDRTRRIALFRAATQSLEPAP